MTVLSRPGILKAIEEKRIRIEPFHESHLKTASYDVTLHDQFYDVCDDDYAQSTGEKHSGDVYTVGVPFINQNAEGQPGIYIDSGRRVLACTREFAGGRLNIVAEMRARSSTARHGLTVCSCAGWGDVGFRGRWTMEIYNMNPFPVFIPFGVRIAQLIFHEVSHEIQDYENYAADGNYAADLDWKPEDMLPKPLTP